MAKGWTPHKNIPHANRSNHERNTVWAHEDRGTVPAGKATRRDTTIVLHTTPYPRYVPPVDKNPARFELGWADLHRAWREAGPECPEVRVDNDSDERWVRRELEARGLTEGEAPRSRMWRFTFGTHLPVAWPARDVDWDDREYEAFLALIDAFPERHIDELRDQYNHLMRGGDQ